jgi:hypothetical protein
VRCGYAEFLPRSQRLLSLPVIFILKVENGPNILYISLKELARRATAKQK